MIHIENKWKPAESIDDVRKELRNAIFWTNFQVSAAEVNNNESRIELCRQGASSFAEFGVRAGLIPIDEGNDWLDAIWGRKTPAEVALKYLKDVPNVEDYC